MAVRGMRTACWLAGLPRDEVCDEEVEANLEGDEGCETCQCEGCDLPEWPFVMRRERAGRGACGWR
jgi:hypothetical protein